MIKKTLVKSIWLYSCVSSLLVFASDQVHVSIENKLENIGSIKKEKNQLHSLFALFWEWQLEENPEDATYLGYPGKHDQWKDLSFDAKERHDLLVTQFLNTLHSIPLSNLEKQDKVSVRILETILDEDQESAKFQDHYLLLDQMDGIHLSIPLIIELMPTKTLQDYHNILSRLSKIPDLLKQATHLLKAGIKLGITPPQVAIQGVESQIQNQLIEDPFDSPLLTAFKKFPALIDDETQAKLVKQAISIYRKSVLPAWREFYSYVTESYIPHCRTYTAFSDLPNGRKWYENKVKHSTTTNLTPDEIHEIGLKEVERIGMEMHKVMKSTGFKGTLDEFYVFLNTDPQFFYSSRDELLKGYRTLTRQIEAKLSLLFSKLPSLPFEVIPIPSYSEETQIGAYYCPGSIADQRPGYFFINTCYPEQRPKWEMIPLALHEAVPGHHLQISLAQELNELPEFRKHLSFTAYIEGWGLYSEGLGSELGFYHDPYALFGRLSYEMLRAIRLVVDTGMHAKGWSRTEAISFFKQHVGCMSDHEIETEVDRYLVMPAQALAYKIGSLKIEEMRHLAEQALGDNFDIHDFHEAWLQNGTVPLDIAESQIREWIHNCL